MTGWLAVGLLFGLILINVPIGFALMVTATAAMHLSGIDLLTIPIQMFFGTNNFPLLAIPMFILMGELMSATTISDRLLHLAGALVGWIRGGLAHVNVVTSMFFAEMSGSGVADAAALTRVFVPGMARAGYPPAYAAAVTSVTATLGIIIPPSIPMVLYGVTTHTSIRDLFLGGVVPGLLLGGAYMVTNHLFALRYGFPRDRRFDAGTLGQAARGAAIPLLIPVLVVGGLVGGVFTPTEASAVGVAVALIFGLTIGRELTLAGLVAVLHAAARQSAVVMMLVAGSAVLGQYLANERLPQAVAAGLVEVTADPALMLLIMNMFLLFLGMFLHASAAIIVVVPMLLPVAQQIGLDPVHFGVIVVLNLGIGQQTPPVASIMLTVCSVSGLKIHQVLAYAKWYLLAMFVVLMMVSYIPVSVVWFRLVW